MFPQLGVIQAVKQRQVFQTSTRGADEELNVLSCRIAMLGYESHDAIGEAGFQFQDAGFSNVRRKNSMVISVLEQIS